MVRFEPLTTGVVTSESVSRSSTITDNPVEGGSNIQDHVFTQPLSFQISGKTELPAYPDSFCSLLCVKGSGTLSGRDEKSAFRAGDSFFLPCSKERLKVEGDCELILTHV